MFLKYFSSQNPETNYFAKMASRGLMANPLEFKVVSPIKNGVQLLQVGLSSLRFSSQGR